MDPVTLAAIIGATGALVGGGLNLFGQMKSLDQQKQLAEQQRKDAFLRSLMGMGGGLSLPAIQPPPQMDLLSLIKQLSNLGQ